MAWPDPLLDFSNFSMFLGVGKGPYTLLFTPKTCDMKAAKKGYDEYTALSWDSVSFFSKGPAFTLHRCDIFSLYLQRIVCKAIQDSVQQAKRGCAKCKSPGATPAAERDNYAELHG